MEKVLKAFWVKNNDVDVPPKIHNLLRLAQLSNIYLKKEDEDFLDIVNRFMLESRYPEFKKEFYKLATKEFARENLNKISEYYKWFKSQLI